jgi:uncharacterized protein (DUF362 family)
MSVVAVVKGNSSKTANGFDRVAYSRLLMAGLAQLSGGADPPDYLHKLLGGQTVGLKTNCLTRKLNSTPVALVDALTELLVRSGYAERDIVVWDRTNRELAAAGYELNVSGKSRRCVGTDANGVGYSRDFYSYGEVNSLVTRILTEMVDANINLPILKDHSIAGISGGLKNMYGAIHNPNKFHGDNCNPFCAQVSRLEPIYRRHRLTIMDAVRVQYHGGPGYVPGYRYGYGGLLLSEDPIAVDRVGQEIVERLRETNGQPSLAKAGRPVKYLKIGQEIGLGQANLNEIDVRVLLVDETGGVTRGKLM